MKIVTGGAGFIGSRIISKLNECGHEDILVIDDLSDGAKMRNLASIRIADFIDADDFIERVLAGHDFGKIDTVFHMGACSSTTEWNGQFLMRRNYEYSKHLLHWTSKIGSSLIYASSASVYGDGYQGFQEDPSFENPINMYAYSKYLFDQYVRRWILADRHHVVGLRFFNVYGPNESHKGSMASVVFHANSQLQEQGEVKLFGKLGSVKAGEQKRDFVHVDDCANVANWFSEQIGISGIYNVGSGNAHTFNELAEAVIDWHGHGRVKYIQFPEHLKDSYQSFTQADISSLRKAGYAGLFRDVRAGVFDYLNWLHGENRSCGMESKVNI